MNAIVIVTSDSNKDYTEFYPIVKNFWEYLGFNLKYFKVGDTDYPVVSGIPTSLQAQILRLYAPTKFENDLILISDIDMLPLDKQYFLSRLPKNDDEFSIYSSDAYAEGRYPMCYIASRGKNFEIFKASKTESWESFVRRLHSLNLGWNTDELYMSSILNSCGAKLIKHTRGWKNGIALNRFDRANWFYNSSKYIDAHCPRPYSKYKEIIDSLETYLSL